MSTVVGLVLLAGLGAAALLAGWRLLLGPSLADRVVALDLVAMVGVAMAGLAAVLFRQPALLDVALGIAVISFVGTVAFARYLELRRRP